MIYDVNNKIIDNPDLTKGYIIKSTKLKDNIVPIDNIKKFAYNKEDFEQIDKYIPYTVSEINRINNPTPDEDRDAMLVDMEYRLTLLELGV